MKRDLRYPIVSQTPVDVDKNTGGWVLGYPYIILNLVPAQELFLPSVYNDYPN